MATYFVNLPSTDVKAEIEAPSSRQARTAYLDYLVRNKIVPWRGRNLLRESIITDRIESGQVPIDVKLNYKLKEKEEEPTEEIVIGPEVETDVPTRVGRQSKIAEASQRLLRQGIF